MIRRPPISQPPDTLFPSPTLVRSRDGGAVAAMMGEFDSKRAMTIPADMRSGASGLFSSARIDGDAMALALRWAQEHGGQIIDPHSAVGLADRKSTRLNSSHSSASRMPASA